MRGRPERRGLLALVVPVVGCIALCVAWSLVTPLMAAYDEPAHLYAGAAIVRGQFDPPLDPIEPVGRLHRVEIPDGIASLQHIADCLHGQPEANATCGEGTVPGGYTQYSRHPQTYYVSIGWTTLVADGRAAARLARVVSAVMTGTLFGLGLWTLRRYHRGGFARLAAAVALTPLVVSIGGTINAAALATASAFAAACGLAAMVSTGATCRDRPPTALLWVTAASMSVFVITRSDALLWAGLVVGAVFVAAGWRTAWRWFADRASRPAVALVAGSAVSAGVWFLVAGVPPLLRVPGVSNEGNAVEASASQILPRLGALRGDFLGLQPPAWIGAIYLAGLVVLVVSATRYRRRLVVAAASLTLAVLVASVVSEASKYSEVGPWWSTRYMVFALVAVPLLLAAWPSDEPAWVRRMVPVVAATAQGLTMAWVFHRYGAGVHGPWWIGSYEWSSPLGGVGIVVAAIGALAAFAFALGGRWEPNRSTVTPERTGDTWA